MANYSIYLAWTDRHDVDGNQFDITRVARAIWHDASSPEESITEFLDVIGNSNLYDLADGTKVNARVFKMNDDRETTEVVYESTVIYKNSKDV